jgi:pyruvate/2-oxoglutarate dehydrogenase complex dihydrolipoamide dehydrogenase (E3) component
MSTDSTDTIDPNDTDPDSIDQLVETLRHNLDIKDRTYRLTTYENCFVGSEACEWMVESGVAEDVHEAEVIGNLLLEADVFHHVLRDHNFKNDYLFYRFTEDESHGHQVETDDGDSLSWSDLMGRNGVASSARSLQPALPEQIVLESAERVENIGVSPMDDANTELLDQVHPPGWVNPEPDGRYNMVVVGAGTGGLVTAGAVAGLGGKVALVEKHLMGGDCLNFGCVPSKALLRSAQAAADVRDAEQFGVHVDGDVRVDFGEVMERVRSLRARISHHDSAERFARELGVDVFLGHGEFTGRNTLAVDDKELTFSKACIATGAQPVAPPIPGLDEAPYLTNQSLFNLTEQPDRLGIIGLGPIGTEMAQAFARLGTDVVAFDVSDRILGREPEDAAAIVRDAIERDGVDLHLGANIEQVTTHETPGDQWDTTTIHLADGHSFEFDRLLVSTGRRPNVDGLGLNKAGIEADPKTGIDVDHHLRTTNSDVYAVGDVATRYQFTHAADFMARIVVRNALFFGRQQFDDLLIPWCTYTDPEIAHVGLYPDDLDERGIDYETYTKQLDEVDRAITEGATDGLIRVHVDGSGRIQGGTIVAPEAGDLISEIAVAMQADMTLDDLADVIHPYPTIAGGIRQIGDDFSRSKLTVTVKTLLRRILSLRR